MDNHNDISDSNDVPSDWTLYDGSRRLDPWEIISGCEGWNDHDARRAARDGVKLYARLSDAPDIPALREHNRAAREQWEAEQEAKRRDIKKRRRKPSSSVQHKWLDNAWVCCTIR
ncbi:hypothetical protein [Mycobacterium sp. ENV421]|uniref:hypothetical protein n=1 Tax=Mycobacterium sp. ENV421 TaxID=1213407 RepID=UPI00115A896C|nr:hypothetical protein [Mycobacterium sp. ENV421]